MKTNHSNLSSLLFNMNDTRKRHPAKLPDAPFESCFFILNCNLIIYSLSTWFQMVKALCLSARRHFCKESTESEGFLSLWHTGWCTNLSLYSAEIPWQHFDMNASSVLYGWEKSFPELAINPIYRMFHHVRNLTFLGAKSWRISHQLRTIWYGDFL